MEQLQAFYSKNQTALGLVLRWILLWLFLAGFHNVVLRPAFGFDGTNYLTMIYYLLSAVLILFLYRVKRALPHHENLPRQLGGLALFVAVVLGMGFWLNEVRPITLERLQYIQEGIQFSFPLFQWNTWAVKGADILYQQVMLVAILYRLSVLPISKKETLWLTSVGFTLLHFPLVLIFGWSGFYFIVPSMFAGFIFTYLLLYTKKGVFYSFAIHLTFYFALGVWIREMA